LKQISGDTVTFSTDLVENNDKGNTDSSTRQLSGSSDEDHPWASVAEISANDKPFTAGSSYKDTGKELSKSGESKIPEHRRKFGNRKTALLDIKLVESNEDEFILELDFHLIGIGSEDEGILGDILVKLECKDDPMKEHDCEQVLLLYW